MLWLPEVNGTSWNSSCILKQVVLVVQFLGWCAVFLVLTVFTHSDDSNN